MFNRKDNNWLKIQEEINSFLGEYLSRLEWYYGEGRAPFAFPPQYKMKRLLFFPAEYCCILYCYDYKNPYFSICSRIPDDLFIKVKNKVYKDFGGKQVFDAGNE